MYSSYLKLEAAVGRLVISTLPLLLAHYLSEPFSPYIFFQASTSTQIHTVPKLIAGAEKQYQELLSEESTTYSTAYQAYIKRRGRRTPSRL